MALTRLYCHDTYFDATDGFTYTPGMRLTLDPATQSARITRLTNSGVFSTDETLDPSAPGPIGDDTPSTGAFTTLTATATGGRVLSVRRDRDNTFARTEISLEAKNDAGAFTTSLLLTPALSDVTDGSEESYIEFAGMASGSLELFYRSRPSVSHEWFLSGSSIGAWDATGLGINETSPNYRLDVNGAIGFKPGSSVTPVDNGDVVFELTNNTTLTVKAKGSDGVVRSGTITLS